jgi:uncharacterized surface protein with fasciclin (FAS1) repeats
MAMIQRAMVAAAVELAMVGPGNVGSRIQSPEALKKIPLYDHVVAGEVRAAQALGSATLMTLNGRSLTLSSAGGSRVNDASMVATDIGARSGVVHVIGTALRHGAASRRESAGSA